MKRYIFLIFAPLFFISADSVGRPETSADDYVLIFSDEFNQPNGSAPDKAVWSCPPRSNKGWNRWVKDIPEVAYIRKGKLVCRAIPNRAHPTDTAKMLTGAVFSRKKFEFRYGKIEVRMKTNLKVGNFTSAWLRTWESKEQPLYSEIDIVGMMGNLPRSLHTVHSELTTKNPKHGTKNHFAIDCNVKKWHVYGVIWTPENIVWTLDGKKVGEYRKSKDPQLLSKGQWSFDYPLFIVLNQSVGSGGYAHFMPQYNDIYETQFDWVRVYQKRDSR